MSMSGTVARRVAKGLGWASFAFLLVAAIFALRAELAWRYAVALSTSGKWEEAVRAARGVFDLYVPGNPRLQSASRMIWDIAEREEEKGDDAAALAHYRILRSAWIGAHPLGGDDGWIARTEPRIARLAAARPPETPYLAARPQEEREARTLAEMRSPRRPYGPWGAVAALGFACWVGATVGLIARGFTKDGRLGAGALGWAALLAVGYAVWIVGMMRA
jgi:hypothetical protein